VTNEVHSCEDCIIHIDLLDWCDILALWCVPMAEFKAIASIQLHQAPSIIVPHFQVPSIINRTLAVPDKAVYQQSFFDGMSVDSSTPNNLLFNTESANSDAEFDYRQNRAIQVALWNLQHPQSCETAKLLVLSEFHHSGFGSTLHLRALQFMMGLDYRVVVDDPGMFWEQTSHQKEYCKSTSS